MACEIFSAAPAAAVLARPALASVPESVAAAGEAWRAPSASAKTVYLLEDAHTNPSGQANVARTLELLFEKEGVRDVCLEAGAGDVSLSFLRRHASAAARRRVGGSLLRQGRLQGGEYFDLVSDRAVSLWGVEDQALYARSVETYRRAAAAREGLSAHLDRADAAVRSLKGAVLNPFLAEFDAKYQRCERGEMPLTEYLDYLASEAARLGLPMGARPHLRAFAALRKAESKIDFEKASAEQRDAILSLSEDELHTLVRDSSPARLASRETDAQRARFALLRERLGGKISGYPELSKYFRYLRQASRISAEKVLDERASLERDLAAALALDPDEKRLLEAQAALKALRGLVSLSLTPREFDAYRAARAESGFTRVTAFLNKMIMDSGERYDDAVFLPEGFDAAVAECEAFYALTLARDEKMVANVVARMESRGVPRAALVAGGYHSPNLKRLFRERGVSFVCLTPRVLKETDRDRYERILLSQNSFRPAGPGVSANMPWQIFMEAAAARLSSAPFPPSARELVGGLAPDEAAAAAMRSEFDAEIVRRGNFGAAPSVRAAARREITATRLPPPPASEDPYRMWERDMLPDLDGLLRLRAPRHSRVRQWLTGKYWRFWEKHGAAIDALAPADRVPADAWGAFSRLFEIPAGTPAPTAERFRGLEPELLDRQLAMLGPRIDGRHRGRFLVFRLNSGRPQGVGYVVYTRSESYLGRPYSVRYVRALRGHVTSYASNEGAYVAQVHLNSLWTDQEAHERGFVRRLKRNERGVTDLVLKDVDDGMKRWKDAPAGSARFARDLLTDIVDALPPDAYVSASDVFDDAVDEEEMHMRARILHDVLRDRHGDEYEFTLTSPWTELRFGSPIAGYWSQIVPSDATEDSDPDVFVVHGPTEFLPMVWRLAAAEDPRLLLLRILPGMGEEPSSEIFAGKDRVHEQAERMLVYALHADPAAREAVTRSAESARGYFRALWAALVMTPSSVDRLASAATPVEIAQAYLDGAAVGASLSKDADGARFRFVFSRQADAGRAAIDAAMRSRDFGFDRASQSFVKHSDARLRRLAELEAGLTGLPHVDTRLRTPHFNETWHLEGGPAAVLRDHLQTILGMYDRILASPSFEGPHARLLSLVRELSAGLADDFEAAILTHDLGKYETGVRHGWGWSFTGHEEISHRLLASGAARYKGRAVSENVKLAAKYHDVHWKVSFGDPAAVDKLFADMRRDFNGDAAAFDSAVRFVIAVSVIDSLGSVRKAGLPEALETVEKLYDAYEARRPGARLPLTVSIGALNRLLGSVRAAYEIARPLDDHAVGLIEEDATRIRTAVGRVLRILERSRITGPYHEVLEAVELPRSVESSLQDMQELWDVMRGRVAAGTPDFDAKEAAFAAHLEEAARSYDSAVQSLARHPRANYGTRLSGAVILRYADTYFTPGGVSAHLRDLNRGLLEREDMTIYQFYPVTGRESVVKAPGDEERIGRGKIVYMPIGAAPPPSRPRPASWWRPLARSIFSGSAVRPLKGFARYVIFHPSFASVSRRLPLIGGRVRRTVATGEEFAASLATIAPALSGKRVLFINHSPSNEAAVHLQRAVEPYGIPSAFEYHGGGELLDWSQRRFMSLLAKKSKPSGVTLRGLGKTLGPSAVNLWNGIDMDLFDPGRVPQGRFRAKWGIPEGRAVILVPARVEPSKGHRDMLAAADILKRAGLSFTVVFAGEHQRPGFREELEAFAASRGLSDSVLFVGNLPSTELAEAFADADVAALPSHGEGFPRIVMEAQAMGVPVVATDVGGTADGMRDGETGFLVPRRRPARFAERVRELLTDPGKRARFGDAARRFSRERFTIDKLVERHRDFYLAAMGEGSSERIGARLSREAFLEAFAELDRRARKEVFDVRAKARLADKLASLGLESGRSALVVGPAAGDYLPAVLGLAGLRVSELEPDGLALDSQKRRWKILGIEAPLEAVASAEELAGGYDYAFVFAVLNDVVENVLLRRALVTSYATTLAQMEGIEEGAKRGMSAEVEGFLAPLVAKLAPEGRVFVNDIPISIPLADVAAEALRAIGEKNDARYEREEGPDLDDLSLHSGYVTESRRGAAFRRVPGTRLAPQDVVDARIFLDKYLELDQPDKLFANRFMADTLVAANGLTRFKGSSASPLLRLEAPLREGTLVPAERQDLFASARELLSPYAVRVSRIGGGVQIDIKQGSHVYSERFDDRNKMLLALRRLYGIDLRVGLSPGEVRFSPKGGGGFSATFTSPSTLQPLLDAALNEHLGARLPLKTIGFVGLGVQGQRHLDAALALEGREGLEIRAVARGNFEAVDRKYDAQRGRLTLARGEAEKVLDDPEVEAVVISTAAKDHYAHVKKALENGKHVLVEKPFVLKASEADELTALAEAKGLVLMVGHQHLYAPLYGRLKELVDSGAFGEIESVEADFLNPYRPTIDYSSDVVEDLATHDLYMLSGLFGAPTEIGRVLNASRPDPARPKKLEAAEIALGFGKIPAVVRVSREYEPDPAGGPVTVRAVRVRGTKAAAEFFYGDPNRLTVVPADGSAPSVLEDARRALGPQLLSFFEAVEREAAVPSDARSAAGVVAAVEKIREKLSPRPGGRLPAKSVGGLTLTVEEDDGGRVVNYRAADRDGRVVVRGNGLERIETETALDGRIAVLELHAYGGFLFRVHYDERESGRARLRATVEKGGEVFAGVDRLTAFETRFDGIETLGFAADAGERTVELRASGIRRITEFGPSLRTYEFQPVLGKGNAFRVMDRSGRHLKSFEYVNRGILGRADGVSVYAGVRHGTIDSIAANIARDWIASETGRILVAIPGEEAGGKGTVARFLSGSLKRRFDSDGRSAEVLTVSVDSWLIDRYGGRRPSGIYLDKFELLGESGFYHARAELAAGREAYVPVFDSLRRVRETAGADVARAVAGRPASRRAGRDLVRVADADRTLAIRVARDLSRKFGAHVTPGNVFVEAGTGAFIQRVRLKRGVALVEGVLTLHDPTARYARVVYVETDPDNRLLHAVYRHRRDGRHADLVEKQVVDEFLDRSKNEGDPYTRWYLAFADDIVMNRGSYDGEFRRFILGASETTDNKDVLLALARHLLYVPDADAVNALLRIARTAKDADVRAAALRTLNTRLRPWGPDLTSERFTDLAVMSAYGGYIPARDGLGPVVSKGFFTPDGDEILDVRFTPDGETIVSVRVSLPDPSSPGGRRTETLAAASDFAGAYGYAPSPIRGVILERLPDERVRVTVAVDDALVAGRALRKGESRRLSWETKPLSRSFEDAEAVKDSMNIHSPNVIGHHFAARLPAVTAFSSDEALAREFSGFARRHARLDVGIVDADGLTLVRERLGAESPELMAALDGVVAAALPGDGFAARIRGTDDYLVAAPSRDGALAADLRSALAELAARRDWPAPLSPGLALTATAVVVPGVSAAAAEGVVLGKYRLVKEAKNSFGRGRVYVMGLGQAQQMGFSGARLPVLDLLADEEGGAKNPAKLPRQFAFRLARNGRASKVTGSERFRTLVLGAQQIGMGEEGVLEAKDAAEAKPLYFTTAPCLSVVLFDAGSGETRYVHTDGYSFGGLRERVERAGADWAGRPGVFALLAGGEFEADGDLEWTEELARVRQELTDVATDKGFKVVRAYPNFAGVSTETYFDPAKKLLVVREILEPGTRTLISLPSLLAEAKRDGPAEEGGSAGTRLTVAEALRALVGERDPEARASLAERAGLDARPVRFGLLDTAFVADDMEVRKKVNPDHRPLRGLYRGAGADVTNFLLSTDAREADFEAFYDEDWTAAALEEMKKFRWEDHDEERRDHIREDYLDFKRGMGYGPGVFFDEDGSEPDFIAEKYGIALALELLALGVDLSKVRVDTDPRGFPRIRFEWTYPGSKEETYSISFRTPSREPYESTYDIYYQRAGEVLPSLYEIGVLEKVDAALAPGAYSVTDDHGLDMGYHDHGPQFPYAWAETAVPHRDLTETAVFDVKRRSIEDRDDDPWDEPGLRYGWKVTVRQKPAAARAAAKPRGARLAAFSEAEADLARLSRRAAAGSLRENPEDALARLAGYDARLSAFAGDLERQIDAALDKSVDASAPISDMKAVRALQERVARVRTAVQAAKEGKARPARASLDDAFVAGIRPKPGQSIAVALDGTGPSVLTFRGRDGSKVLQVFLAGRYFKTVNLARAAKRGTARVDLAAYARLWSEAEAAFSRPAELPAGTRPQAFLHLGSYAGLPEALRRSMLVRQLAGFAARSVNYETVYLTGTPTEVREALAVVAETHSLAARQSGARPLFAPLEVESWKDLRLPEGRRQVHIGTHGYFAARRAAGDFEALGSARFVTVADFRAADGRYGMFAVGPTLAVAEIVGSLENLSREDARFADALALFRRVTGFGPDRLSEDDFLGFLQGRPDLTARFAMPPIQALDLRLILRVYALGARMAGQAA